MLGASPQRSDAIFAHYASIPAGVSNLKNLDVFKSTLDVTPAKDTQEEEP